ncbi:MAG TPA: RnfABCDGE type electron transport complex subunit G, partial [Clostridiales bacterium]|nr:RnfABCDGE type electron transport complex subunit G [Clostridiales bacterium]
MQKLKGILLPTLSLLMICLVCAGLLAFTNGFTKEYIEKAEKEQILNMLSSVIESDRFSEQKEYSTGRGEPYPYYDAFDKDGNRIGRVLITSTNGYGGILRLVTGIDAEGKVTGLKILELHETPGLGSKVNSESFLNQFKGISRELILSKAGNTGASLGQVGLIDAISGATV